MLLRHLRSLMLLLLLLRFHFHFRIAVTSPVCSHITVFFPQASLSNYVSLGPRLVKVECVKWSTIFGFRSLVLVIADAKRSECLCKRPTWTSTMDTKGKAKRYNSASTTIRVIPTSELRKHTSSRSSLAYITAKSNFLSSKCCMK